jgi:hypothetical protein
VHLLFFAVQQFHRFGDVGHVRRGYDHRVHQLAVPVRADVRFQPKIPLVAPSWSYECADRGRAFRS